MAGLLYFLPKANAGQADFDQAGITVADRGHGASPSGVTVGPSGSGTLFAPHTPKGRPDTKCRYLPDEQTWTECNNGKFWIGFYTDDRPKPEDLATDEQFNGYPITLEDGNDWVIPIARSFSGGTTLPEALILGLDGKTIRRPLDRFAEIEKQAQLVIADIMRQLPDACVPTGWDVAEVPLTDEQNREIAQDALGLNYRIGPWEINALLLLNTLNVDLIGHALVEWPAVEAAMTAANEAAVQKKNADALGTDSTNGGVTDSLRTITPPTPTSTGTPVSS